MFAYDSEFEWNLSRLSIILQLVSTNFICITFCVFKPWIVWAMSKQQKKKSNTNYRWIIGHRESPEICDISHSDNEHNFSHTNKEKWTKTGLKWHQIVA